MKSREIHLVKRPEGMPKVDEFAVVERDVPDAGEGQILVRRTSTCPLIPPCGRA